MPAAGQSQPGQREGKRPGNTLPMPDETLPKPAKQVGNGPETGARPGAQGKCPRDEGQTALERSTAADLAASGQG